MCTSPVLAKIKYLNGETIDSTTPVVFVLGSAFHKAMEVYYGGSDTQIVSTEEEAIEYGLKAGMEHIEMYPDGFIKWSNTLDCKQKLYDKLTFAFQAYVKEQPYRPGKVHSTEEKLQEYVEVEWGGKKVELPIQLMGYVDRIDVDDNGDLTVVDYKMVNSFSREDKIDGAKMIAAVFYYFLCYAKYGRAPVKMRYEEVKHSKNRDGSDQVRIYEIVYAENQLFFDLFFRLYQDITDHINGKAVWLPNIDAMFDGDIELIAYINRLDIEEEVAQKLKDAQVDNITDLLKAEIHNANSMKELMATVEKEFISAKGLNYEKMENHEKIQTKMMEHGMMIRFDSVLHGASVDQYRFTPSIGLKMSRVRQYADDVEQVLGKSGIRVLAPIPDTTFIGFEVPKKARTFPQLPSKKDGYNLAIGQDVMGETMRFDIREAPHMLVAGSTGSGKSVFLNALITQLNRLTKKQAEIHLYDPKMVELAQFADAKNVVAYETHIEEISKHLTMLTDEMTRRYKRLKALGLRSIEGTDITPKFVFIDEFGDIIAQNHKIEVFEDEKKKTINVSKEVENKVLVLAQKARAAGIHLIISTQRPSVDVITGTIKANFPTKVAFRTAKVIDSHVVIDEDGAEKLLGKGDMLFAPTGGEIIRLQGYNV